MIEIRTLVANKGSFSLASLDSKVNLKTNNNKKNKDQLGSIYVADIRKNNTDTAMCQCFAIVTMYFGLKK